MMMFCVLAFIPKLKISVISQLMTTRHDKMRQEILELEDVGILPHIINFALKEFNL